MDQNVILVIDDDESTAASVEKHLEGQFQVLTLSSGYRALQLAEKGEIHIAILSNNLLDVCSFDLLKTLKKSNPTLPIILISEFETKETIIKAFRTGAIDFLEKPLDKTELSASLNRILSLLRDGETGKQKQLGTKNKKSRARRVSEKYSLSSRPVWLAWLRNLCRQAKGIEAAVGIEVAAGDEGAAGVQSTVGDDNEIQSCPNPAEYAPHLQVFFLGKFHAILNDVVIDSWPSRKAKNLFAYLTCHHKRPQYKDMLMEKFWPGSTPASARNCLNATLYSVRHILHSVDPEQEYILFKDDCYAINPETELWLDVEEFSNYWRKAKTMSRDHGIDAALSDYELAAALYKGDFMEEEIYESWAELDRDNLKEIYLVVLDTISHYYSMDGKPATAIDLCSEILAKDNCREDIHQRLMKCYCRIGQRNKALKQFHKCQEIMQNELEATPSHATVELYEKIRHDLLS